MNGLFTTNQAVKYLFGKSHKNAEFKNANNENLEIFKCVDGTIGIGEIGDGLVKTFNKDNYKNDLWILSFNPYK